MGNEHGRRDDNQDEVEIPNIGSLLNCPQHQMDKEEFEFFLACSAGDMMESIGAPPPPQEVLDSISYKIIDKRLGVFKIPTTPWTKVLLSGMSPNPAVAVMYCHALAHIHYKTENPVTIEALTVYFGDGFPNEEDLNEFWDNQKIPSEGLGSDNALDRFPEVWTREYFEKVEDEDHHDSDSGQ